MGYILQPNGTNANVACRPVLKKRRVKSQTLIQIRPFVVTQACDSFAFDNEGVFPVRRHDKRFL